MKLLALFGTLLSSVLFFFALAFPLSELIATENTTKITAEVLSLNIEKQQLGSAPRPLFWSLRHGHLESVNERSLRYLSLRYTTPRGRTIVTEIQSHISAKSGDTLELLVDNENEEHVRLPSSWISILFFSFVLICVGLLIRKMVQYIKGRI